MGISSKWVFHQSKSNSKYCECFKETVPHKYLNIYSNVWICMQHYKTLFKNRVSF